MSGLTLPVTKENRDVVVADDGMTVRGVGQWGDLILDVGAASTTARSPLSAFSHGLVDDDPAPVLQEGAS